MSVRAVRASSASEKRKPSVRWETSLKRSFAIREKRHMPFGGVLNALTVSRFFRNRWEEGMVSHAFPQAVFPEDVYRLTSCRRVWDMLGIWQLKAHWSDQWLTDASFTSYHKLPFAKHSTIRSLHPSETRLVPLWGRQGKVPRKMPAAKSHMDLRFPGQTRSAFQVLCSFAGSDCDEWLWLQRCSHCHKVFLAVRLGVVEHRVVEHRYTSVSW